MVFHVMIFVIPLQTPYPLVAGKYGRKWFANHKKCSCIRIPLLYDRNGSAWHCTLERIKSYLNMLLWEENTTELVLSGHPSGNGEVIQVAQSTH